MESAHGEVYSILDYVIKFVSGLRGGWWFSPGPPVYSTNKTDRHDITAILLKVALNTITSYPFLLMYIIFLDCSHLDIIINFRRIYYPPCKRLTFLLCRRILNINRSAMIWPAIWTIAVKVKYLKDTLLCASIYQLNNDWINRKVIPSIFDKYKTPPNTTQKKLKTWATQNLPDIREVNTGVCDR